MVQQILSENKTVFLLTNWFHVYFWTGNLSLNKQEKWIFLEKK